MTWIFPHIPRVSHASRFFRLVEEIWSSMSVTMNQSSMEKSMIKDSSASSAMPIVLSSMRKKNSDSWSQTTSMMPSTWWGTSKC